MRMQPGLLFVGVGSKILLSTCVENLEESILCRDRVFTRVFFSRVPLFEECSAVGKARLVIHVIGISLSVKLDCARCAAMFILAVLAS